MKPLTSAADLSDRPYFQLILLWSRMRSILQRYEEVAGESLSSCGGRNERQILPDLILARGLLKPDTVSIARYPSMRAFIDSQHDERMHEFRSSNLGAYRMATVEGPVVRSEPSRHEHGDCQYVVEIARFRGGEGAATYEKYQKEAAPLLSRYRYRVETEIQPEFTNGLPFRADVAKVGLFEMQDGLSRLHADPDYERIIRLHRAATLNAVWIIGRARVQRVAASKEFS